MSFQATWASDTSSIGCESNPEYCVDEALPDHVRSQTFAGLRWNLGATFGLGKGFQLGVSVPIVLKAFTIEHTLPDGSPYATPYSLLTGPSEVDGGLGDTSVVLRLVGRVPATPLLLNAGVGASLPTGKISPNPFDPALPASRRQHRQFGNGTVDPQVQLGLVVGTQPFGLLVSGSAQFPLYAGKYGYQGPIAVSGAVGLLASVPAPLETLRLLMLLDLSHAGPARWNGEIARNSGRDALGVRLGFDWEFKPQLALRGEMLVVPLETLQGEQFRAPISLSVGLSGVLDIRPKAARGHH